MAKITLPMSLIDTDENIQKLAVSAVLKGARPTYNGANVIYPIGDPYLTTGAANYVVSVGGTVDDYFIQRYKAVKTLSNKLPVSLPGSTVEDEGGNITPVTWQDVQDLPTVNVSPIAGTYYFNVTAHQSHRGLTPDEFAAIPASVNLIKQEDIPAREDEIEPLM